MKLKTFLAVALCLAISSPSWADLSNIASVTYQDAGGNSYGPTQSNSGNPVIVTVTAAPSITSGNTASGDKSAAFSYTITASNGPTSYAVAGGSGLPAGVTLNTTSGIISGTPTVSGTFTVNMTASNTGGASAAVLLTITIRAAAVITLQKTASVTSAVSGDPVTFTITYTNTSNGAASNVVVTDVVPTGSTLVPNSLKINGAAGGSGTTNLSWTIGTVGASGTPSATGNVSFQVKVN